MFVQKCSMPSNKKVELNVLNTLTHSGNMREGNTIYAGHTHASREREREREREIGMTLRPNADR